MDVAAAEPLAGGRDQLNVGMRDEEPQQLTPGVPGGAHHGDLQPSHRRASTARRSTALPRLSSSAAIDSRGVWSRLQSPGPYTAASHRQAGQTTLRSQVPVLVV